MRLLLGILALAAAGAARADEGMWLFNNPPNRLLQQRYNFTATPQWLAHLQKASVRFSDGGSGSFVSPDGLVITNHHVGSGCIQNVSTAQHDYIKTGFYARTRAEELRCPGEELNVLESIEDVTRRVESAVRPGMSAAAAQKARRAVINTIEKESLDKTGLTSEVVPLYNGGQYHLYRYKRYTDVRLVFAPERGIAFFGGDPDNFEYPRYDLDICFFHVYENDKPVRAADYLKWNPAGANDGELVFVAGNPGRTERLDTVTHLEFLRDKANPFTFGVNSRRELMLRVFSERSLENAREAQDDVFYRANSRKAYQGMEAGLLDPALMAGKRAQEQALRSAVAANSKLKAEYGDAWDQVNAAMAAYRPIYDDLYLLERRAAFNSELYTFARILLRMGQESAKPNAGRLPEYSEANLPSVKQELFSTAPIYPNLEITKLADSLTMFAEMKGEADPLVRQVLAGKSPQQRANELVRGTKLADVAVRKQLAAGGLKAVEASKDPMIELARLVDPAARKLRTAYDQKVDEPLKQAYGKIARARFAIYGAGLYPDATFTLRLAFGQVKGYTENGRPVAWTTTLGGTYRHAAEHDDQPPFNLPKSWIDSKSRLRLDTPFNSVNTADIVGGNSGSPVVNRAGEFVGIIFDGNIQSLVLDYIYTDKQARAVFVQSAGILEALRKVYGAGSLIGELVGGAVSTDGATRGSGSGGG